MKMKNPSWLPGIFKHPNEQNFTIRVFLMLMQSQWEYKVSGLLMCFLAPKPVSCSNPLTDAFQPLLNMSLKFMVKTQPFV